MPDITDRVLLIFAHPKKHTPEKPYLIAIWLPNYLASGTSDDEEGQSLCPSGNPPHAVGYKTMRLNDKDRMELFSMGRNLSPTFGDIFQNSYDLNPQMVKSEMATINLMLEQIRLYKLKITEIERKTLKE